MDKLISPAITLILTYRWVHGRDYQQRLNQQRRFLNDLVMINEAHMNKVFVLPSQESSIKFILSHDSLRHRTERGPVRQMELLNFKL